LYTTAGPLLSPPLAPHAEGEGTVAAEEQGGENQELGVSGVMTGLEAMQTHVDLGLSNDGHHQLATVLEQALTGQGPGEQDCQHGQRPSGGNMVLVSAAGTAIINDYDDEWWPLVHVTTFPHGKGTRPGGMSLERWLQRLLWRYPHKQHSMNVMLVLDANNIITRHAVNRFTHATFTGSPEVA
jgi:hypothetical protein